MRFRNWALVPVLISILGVVEVAVRYFGLVDVPVYDVDTEIGYIPKANQSGIFLNTNDWYFNDKNMPVRRDFDAKDHPNVFLIGNSIIMGGIVFKLSECLTALLQTKFGEHTAIWPIAVGGWTDINDMVYLDRHPEVVATADYVAWEYMAGGLSRVTPWAGEYVFPTHRPVFATWYFVRRYVLPKLMPSQFGSELPAFGETKSSNVESFDHHVGALASASRAAHRGIVWLYPELDQLIEARNKREWMPERQQILKIAEKYGMRVIDIATYPEWNTTLYQTDRIHPNREGNRVLANILYSEISKDLGFSHDDNVNILNPYRAVGKLKAMEEPSPIEQRPPL